MRFLHESTDDNPAHAALRQWPEDALLYDRLAESEVGRLVLEQRHSGVTWPRRRTMRLRNG